MTYDPERSFFSPETFIRMNQVRMVAIQIQLAALLREHQELVVANVEAAKLKPMEDI